MVAPVILPTKNSKGAFATLSLASLAFSIGPGLAKLGPSGATTRVCVH